MNNKNTNNNLNKRQIIIWSLIVVATILISVLVFILFINKQSDDLLKSDNEQINKPIANRTPSDISENLLTGDFNGIREGIDGSIEAVFLQISYYPGDDKTFQISLNAGTNVKLTGFGKFIKETKILESDILGNLQCSIDDNNKLILISISNSSNYKYKLIKE